MDRHSTALNYLSLLIVVCTCLVGCGSKNTSQPASSYENRDKLTFCITWKVYSGRGEAIQKIVDSYNASQDKYVVNLVDEEEDLGTVESNLIKKSPVDVYVLPYRFVQYLGDKGKLTDLTSDFAQQKDFFYPNLWRLGVVDKATYGIPWLGHSVCLLYNKELLDKSSVDPGGIKDIDQLVTACEKVEAKTDAQGIGLVGANHNDVSWMVNQFIYGFGSNLVGPSGKEVVVNNDKARAAIDFYQNTLGPHAQKTWVNDSGIEVMDHFRKQEVAFEFQGPWGVTDIWKNGNPFTVGVIPLDDIGLKAEVGPMMLALPADISPEKKAAAIDLIDYLISKPAQEMIMNGEYSPEHDAYYPFRIPVRSDLAGTLVYNEHPEFIPFIEGLNNPSIDVPVPRWQKIKDDYYAPGLHEVMAGELTIDAFLKNIETEGDHILSEQ
ncbi:MAG: ABC transporter substrate-binding protein [Deltaproteobacteria bacterium]